MVALRKAGRAAAATTASTDAADVQMEVVVVAGAQRKAKFTYGQSGGQGAAPDAAGRPAVLAVVVDGRAQLGRGHRCGAASGEVVRGDCLEAELRYELDVVVAVAVRVALLAHLLLLLLLLLLQRAAVLELRGLLLLLAMVVEKSSLLGAVSEGAMVVGHAGELKSAHARP